MSDIISIAHLHRDFASIQEWREFAEKQFLTISFLKDSNDTLTTEIDHLKKLLAANTQLVGQGPVETIIVSPERGLLDDQILMIQQRAYAAELSLEDVKKLDLLIKNKRIIVEADNAIKATSKKIQPTSEELLKIAQSHG